MQEKIIEIIVLILNEIKNSKQLNEIDLNKLNRDGYTEAEINTAFAWIFSKIENGEKVFNDPAYKSKSHRFFHEAEKSIITTEGMGYLIQMKELGVISEIEEEMVIDKIFMAGYQKAGVEEVKIVLTSVLFDTDLKDSNAVRMVFSNNETIH